jgi:hypothetical protein
LFEQTRGELREVFTAIAQRWQEDAELRQSVVQVAAEAALRHQIG